MTYANAMMNNIFILFMMAGLSISMEANSQTWRINSLDNQKINVPSNTYQPEQKYSCELTRIGKLVVKPLLKDGVIHYELAITDVKDKRNKDEAGVGITKDSLQNTSVTRWRMLMKKILKLHFNCSADNQTCTYQLDVLSRDGQRLQTFLIDGDGNVAAWDSNDTLTNEQRISAQREINARLSNFE